ncbi:hypothetical protein V8E36_004338 [Tilletia maclaganii]
MSRASASVPVGNVLRDSQSINKPAKRAASSSPSKAGSPAKIARRQSFGVSEANVSQSVEDTGKLWEEYFERLAFVVHEQQSRRSSVGRSSTRSEMSSRESRERQAQERQAEIRAAESRLVTLRTELEAELDNLAPMFSVSASLSYHAEEARKLMTEIEGFGMDIARARMERNEGLGDGSAGAPENGAEGEESTDVPIRGTLTTDEAEAYCDAQIDEMQTVQEDIERTNAAVDRAKDELKSAMKAVDRLGYERSREEAMAKEAQAGIGKGGKRDLKMEEACRVSKTQLQTLRGMLGLRCLETTSDCSLRAVYEPRATAAGKDGKAVILDVRLREPGGRLNWFDISLIDAAERDMSRARRVIHIPDGLAVRLEQALDANDLPLLVNEIAVAIQTDVF